jgi:hypothetical protein
MADDASRCDSERRQLSAFIIGPPLLQARRKIAIDTFMHLLVHVPASALNEGGADFGVDLAQAAPSL